MHIQALLHASFEGPGLIAEWARDRQAELHTTRLFAGELPDVTAPCDLLLVMGGPMGVGDEDRFPWLVEEKRYLAAQLRRECPILGICLGAQLLAAVLGAAVTRNPVEEIGWLTVHPDPNRPQSWLEPIVGSPQQVFQWHGDTFAIPSGAARLQRSDACENQSFLYSERVVGLQYHLEMTAEGIGEITRHCGAALVPSPTVRPLAELPGRDAERSAAGSRLFKLLDGLAKGCV